jgi:translation elongation factor EF-Tu-like GTPase
MKQQRKSSGRSKVDNSKAEISVAKIGLISTIAVAIIGMIGTALSAYFSTEAAKAPLLISIQATQTAESRSTQLGVVQTLGPTKAAVTAMTESATVSISSPTAPDTTATDELFVFLINDSFDIPGRGTVVTGHVILGTIYATAYAVILGPGGERLKSPITLQAMSGMVLQEAVRGDELNVLVREIDPDDVVPGMFLVKQNAFPSYSYVIRAIVDRISPHDGPFLFLIDGPVLASSNRVDVTGQVIVGSATVDDDIEIFTSNGELSRMTVLEIKQTQTSEGVRTTISLYGSASTEAMSGSFVAFHDTYLSYQDIIRRLADLAMNSY